VRVRPSYLSRRGEELLRDTTGLERLRVFEVSRRLGRWLGGLAVSVGAASTILAVGTLLDRVPGILNLKAVFSAEAGRTPIILILGLLGLVNLLCGLLLLARE